MNSRSPSVNSPDILPVEGCAALGAFTLAPELIHLNHGSYGAVPKTVQAEQERWRAAIERDPTGFFQNVYPAAVRQSAHVAAMSFGGKASDWVFCENATAAVNSVLASLPLRPGDEFLTTSHAYGAVLKAMRLWAQRKGATVRMAEIPVVVECGDQVVDAIASSLTGRTRLLVIDHITSPTAIVFPVASIVAAAHEAGVPVFVDGAHAPGHVPLDVPSIGADWYTGNAHKWFFAPRGCGLLWTAPKWQDITRPAVLSHGTEQGYTEAFDWIGTRDVSPWLCLDAAGEAFARLGGDALRRRNQQLAAEAAKVLQQAVGGEIAAPSGMQGAMASLCFRAKSDAAEEGLRIREALRASGMVIAAGGLAGHVYVRVSAQIYNELSDYRRCAAMLRECGVSQPVVQVL